MREKKKKRFLQPVIIIPVSFVWKYLGLKDFYFIVFQYRFLSPWPSGILYSDKERKNTSSENIPCNKFRDLNFFLIKYYVLELGEYSN